MQFIKKVFCLVIVTCVLFLLSSCNDQLSAKNVDSLISQIGEVSIDSRSQINETREMFELLSGDEKQNVTMIETLKNAEAQLYELIKESELESIKQRYGNNVEIYSNSVAISQQVASTASESFIGCYGTAYSFYLKNYLEQKGIDDIDVISRIQYYTSSNYLTDREFMNGQDSRGHWKTYAEYEQDKELAESVGLSLAVDKGLDKLWIPEFEDIPAYEDFPLLPDFGIFADCPPSLGAQPDYGENGVAYSVKNLTSRCYELGDYLEICEKLGFYASSFFSVNDATFYLQLKHEIIDTTVHIQYKEGGSAKLIISWD